MRAFPVVAAAGLLLESAGCVRLTQERRIRQPVTGVSAVEDPRFQRSAGDLLEAPLVPGNRVEQLINGDHIFPAMLAAIRDAKRSVSLEMFIWSSGRASDPFVEALSERARAGVKVRVIVDAVGSAKLKKRDIATMEKAGVELAKYNSPLSKTFFRANLRTHRKIMIVDGRIGFTGGVCISDPWLGNAEPHRWRDSMFRVEGPVVAQMQAVFAENWLKTRSEVLHGEDFYPELRPSGPMLAQFVKSGFHAGEELTRLSYLLSIAGARKSIRIAHSYFVPDPLLERALIDAVHRGVKVEVIVPKKEDMPPVGKAAYPKWKTLLDAGVQFWEFSPTLYHCKIMIVDDVWSIVGSANLDDRSLRLDDEANLDVYDRAFAADLVKAFEQDKTKSRRLTAEDMKKRNLFSRMTDYLFAPFRAEL